VQISFDESEVIAAMNYKLLKLQGYHQQNADLVNKYSNVLNTGDDWGRVHPALDMVRWEESQSIVKWVVMAVRDMNKLSNYCVPAVESATSDLLTYCQKFYVGIAYSAAPPAGWLDVCIRSGHA